MITVLAILLSAWFPQDATAHGMPEADGTNNIAVKMSACVDEDCGETHEDYPCGKINAHCTSGLLGRNPATLLIVDVQPGRFNIGEQDILKSVLPEAETPPPRI